MTERIVVGSFAHPGQILADDLTGGWLEQHTLIAALAGDAEAAATFDLPLPPLVQADRDPGAERGVGDLDASQQHVLDVVASGIDVVVDAPPGTATTETVAAIVADAAASGRTVVHLAGTRRAAEALVARLIELGLDGMVLDAAAGNGQGRDIGALVTDRLGAALPEVDADGIQAMRSELSALRGTLSARVQAWHTKHRQFGVSAADAMRALAEITLRRPAPRTQVRLEPAAIAKLAGRGLENARGELAKAATLGTFQLRRSDSPWYGVVLADGDEARATVERVQRLGARTLPALRQRMAVAAAQTGLEPAETLAVWAEQLRMLEGIRAALDVFQPTIFERSAADLVAATAPRGERTEHEALPAAARRRLRKQAKDLVRPGRHVADLHAELRRGAGAAGGLAPALHSGRLAAAARGDVRASSPRRTRWSGPSPSSTSRSARRSATGPCRSTTSTSTGSVTTSSASPRTRASRVPCPSAPTPSPAWRSSVSGHCSTTSPRAGCRSRR
ncbi:hypothetical protein [Salana multivorans]